MNIDLVRTVGTKLVGRGALLAKKFAPEILTGLGIAGGVTAAVMAAKASVNLNDELADTRELIASRKSIRENTSEEDYPTQKYQRDLTVAYALHTKAIFRVYAPAITLGAASVACILGAHGIMYRRNAALMAAYNALDTAFRNYRKRAAEEFGEDKDWEYTHSARQEVTESVDDSGKKTKTKKLIQDPNGLSQYSRVFAEGHPEWKPNAEMNLFWLKCKQTYLNDKLHAQGHLFLNEAYDELGFPRTKAGAVVGWVVDKDGDNFVDFGLYDLDRPNIRDFVNGYEASAVLDFNVDGVIYDKI